MSEMTMSKDYFISLVNQAINENHVVLTTRRDVDILKRDVSELKQDVSELKQDVKVLQKEQHRQGMMLEHIDQKLDTILEIVLPVVKKSENIDTLVDVTERHESCFSDVEHVVKNHIADKSMHRERNS